MRKFGWMLTAAGAAALVGAVALQGAASAAPTAPKVPAKHHHHHGARHHDEGAILSFGAMTPVTGPYVGTTNPIRGVSGGGLPWILKSGFASLSRDGRLFVRVRGLVLANDPSVPAALRGTNPFPDYRALVSCQAIGTGNTATVTNVSTADFPANAKGDSTIFTKISLPQPCFAPIVFVTGPTGTDVWFAVSGG